MQCKNPNQSTNQKDEEKHKTTAGKEEIVDFADWHIGVDRISARR